MRVESPGVARGQVEAGHGCPPSVPHAPQGVAAAQETHLSGVWHSIPPSLPPSYPPVSLSMVFRPCLSAGMLRKGREPSSNLS
ncbi:hypothetical protein E2C01_004931 [Portunus trituberculatus]|uniref:Uncharacterized protein n=1 Tax=Portunus trituberculatus TaxID=210409 RepID=A0A5B7CRU0_PORTR|nr:hypothetical protein [Portunus trituberculatus]